MEEKGKYVKFHREQKRKQDTEFITRLVFTMASRNGIE